MVTHGDKKSKNQNPVHLKIPEILIKKSAMLCSIALDKTLLTCLK